MFRPSFLKPSFTTKLRDAIMSNNTESFEELLELDRRSEESQLDSIDQLTGINGLMCAVSYGNPNYVERLIECGANPKALDSNGHDALWHIDNLVSPIDSNVRESIIGALSSDRAFSNAMAVAIRGNNIEKLAVLLAEKPGAINFIAECDSGKTALMHAVLSGNEEVVQLLLRNGADPSMRDAGGKDALWHLENSTHQTLQSSIELRSKIMAALLAEGPLRHFASDISEASSVNIQKPTVAARSGDAGEQGH